MPTGRQRALDAPEQRMDARRPSDAETRTLRSAPPRTAGSGLEAVDLVQDQDGRPVGDAELAQQIVDGRHVLVDAGVARVDYVEQHVGVGQLLQGRAECRRRARAEAYG